MASPSTARPEIRDIVVALTRDIDTDTRLVFANDDKLAAFAMVAPPPDGGVLGDTFAGVHPDWTGRGIGRELVGWETERLRELRDEMAPGAAWSVDVGSSVKETQATHLFEETGALEQVAELAVEWFGRHLGAPSAREVHDGLRRHHPAA